MYSKSTCEMAGPMTCELIGGKPKADFCNAETNKAGGGFCGYLKSSIMRSCGSDADCKKKPCCSFQKKMMTDMCDGVDTTKLEAQIASLKAGDQCADSDCSAGSAMSAGAPSLHHQHVLAHVFQANAPLLAIIHVT
jgi:hypothetical protein